MTNGIPVNATAAMIKNEVPALSLWLMVVL